MSDESVQTIAARSCTRETADLAIEHLPREQEIDRADLFVQALGTANAAATTPSRGDAPFGRDGGTAARSDSALDGGLEVLADPTRDQIAKARQVFHERDDLQNTQD